MASVTGINSAISMSFVTASTDAREATVSGCRLNESLGISFVTHS
jgi:hypothetical protein